MIYYNDDKQAMEKQIILTKLKQLQIVSAAGQEMKYGKDEQHEYRFAELHLKHIYHLEMNMTLPRLPVGHVSAICRFKMSHTCQGHLLPEDISKERQIISDYVTAAKH